MQHPPPPLLLAPHLHPRLLPLCPLLLLEPCENNFINKKKERNKKVCERLWCMFYLFFVFFFASRLYLIFLIATFFPPLIYLTMICIYGCLFPCCSWLAMTGIRLVCLELDVRTNLYIKRERERARAQLWPSYCFLSHFVFFLSPFFPLLSPGSHNAVVSRCDECSWSATVAAVAA